LAALRPHRQRRSQIARAESPARPASSQPASHSKLRAMRSLCLVCLLASSAAAKPIVITAARLYDGKGDALQKPGRVVVDDDKIIGVGAAAKAPADAQVIDLGDVTLMPGLVDAHTHLSHEASEDWKQDELD